MENYYNYFTEIEEHFWRKRGKNLLVSPLDWCLIDLWKSSGIPLHIALRGIDRSFDSAEKRHRRPPTTLFYCHPAVMEAFEEFGEAQVGASPNVAESPPSPLSRGELLAHLEKLELSLARIPGETPERVREGLTSLRMEVEAGATPNCEEIDRALGRLAERAADWLLSRMEAGQRKELKKEVRKELKIYKKRLSPEMYAKLESNYLAREIRFRNRIPEFSLFHADTE